jgi:hypothetical protein
MTNNKYDIESLIKTFSAHVLENKDLEFSLSEALLSICLAIQELKTKKTTNKDFEANNEAKFEDLGPVDDKNPNAHAFVYRPDNYPGPIALDATIKPNS